MAERTIGIGDTSSFRYIGVQPPLDHRATEDIAERLILPDWVDHNFVYRVQQTSSDGPAYTEFGFDVGDALDWLGTETVNDDTVRVAEQVARLLHACGDAVTIIEGIYPTDFQTPIFGSDWVEMGDIARRLESRGEAQ